MKIHKNININKILFICCLFLAIIKIMLIGGEEIIARDQPLDDFWQILAASRGYWFSSDYNWMMYVHLPVYPYWLGFVNLTGIPLRIAAELFFLGSAFLFVYSLRGLGFSALSLVVSYCFIVFNPASFNIFNYSLAGTFYSPMYLLAIAALITLWNKRDEVINYKYGLYAGLCLAILWHTRKENILLVGLLAIYALFLVVSYSKEFELRRAIYKATVVIIIPVAIIVGASLVVKTLNYAKFGLFVTTEMDSPGYKAAYKALLRIKPDKPIRFVPVPRDVRYKAYTVSPAFRELEPYFEGDFGYAFAADTRKYMGIKDEIAAGWFYWALKNAAVLAGHHGSALEADNYFQKVADEVNAALDAHELESRVVLFSFLDPETSNWLPYLPGSMEKIRSRFVSRNQYSDEHDSPDLPDSVSRAFDIATNRRAAKLQGPPLIVNGWVFAMGDSVSRVEVLSTGGQVLASTNWFASRPDVAEGYSGHGYGDVPEKSGVKLLVTSRPEQLQDARFVVYTNNGGHFDMSFNSIEQGRPYELLDQSADKVLFAFDEVLIPSSPDRIQKLIQNLIWGYYGNILRFLEGLALLSLPFLFYYRKRLKLTHLFVLGLLGYSVVARGALFSLVDASSWPGDQPRYLFAAMQIYGVFLLLWIMCSFKAMSNK